ncbi:V-type proton ATPase 116 kDa subunit a 1-like [Anticarsia gemmatalis]|uniref:V-type proton ATPase 116 kDa subunit a 1-like n=1 Tax=Anticarsia gemmatalis TaxID=129554 RepID=UPI003F75E844
MTLCDVYLQPEVAFEVLSRLGEMGCVQFIDMHPELQLFQRSFVQEVCRCSEMERKLRYMEDEMKLHKIHIPDIQDLPKAVPIHELGQFEAKIEKWGTDISEISANETDLMKNYLELTELLYVLEYIGPLLGRADISTETKIKAKAPAAGDVQQTTGRLFVITGVVNRAKAFAFEMMLWRMSHGMIHYRQAAEDKILIDPATRQEIRKVAFLAICPGEQLSIRINKVCNGFRVNTYPCPPTHKDRSDMISKLHTRVFDLDQVLSKTRYLRCKALQNVGKNFRSWMAQVRKSKAVYHQMNLFNLDITKKCLIGQTWVPDADLEQVNTTFANCCHDLQTNVESFIGKIDHNLVPPTYHRTNEFTRGFQNLINAYGDSTYRELNPGLYTVVTFPFLFAVMFGDVGHGFLVFLFGFWMWRNEKRFLKSKSDNEIWNIIFGGRYVILLMGAFSIFIGACYNDVFGTQFTFGRSYFRNHLSVEDLSKNELIDVDPAKETGSVYLLGVDPIWGLSKNSIMVQNSMKMKLSIIFGVVHMIFGVVLSVVNYCYFKRSYSIYLQFIPEVVFLSFLFFWLVILIYYKWFMYSAKSKYGTSCAPQILILFIDMALCSETQPVEENCKLAYMFDNQRTIQMALLAVALLMVPILLLGSPLYKNRLNQKKRKEAVRKLDSFKRYEYDPEEPEKSEKREQELQDEVDKYTIPFGELMIHQGVHTIEYVLSTISHTASYLRLWALSLAHAELSEMLYHMIFSKLALSHHHILGSLRVFVIFTVWAVFSVCILVVMEGLSAFLHTLRLHWVEFMSKFYGGGGYQFQPFSFKKILASDSDKSEAGCKKFLT